jgi:hypothetical protein
MAASIGVMPLLLLNIFSVTTIPSTKPVARTIANKVNTLMEKPNNHDKEGRD